LTCLSKKNDRCTAVFGGAAGIEPGVDALMVTAGLSLDVIDEWGLSVRGLDGLARVSATR
jgi:hypothetical protein